MRLVNDTTGHLVGDANIKEGSSRIQKTFAPAKIFRIGGDEFAIVLEEQLYEERDLLSRSSSRIPMARYFRDVA
ncbi:MAG: diguanylate cyclase [Bacilli bacterium]|nr:diguanylate cyclase [Bacilli bacterium]